MKILFVVNKLNIGGPQKIVAFLSNNLVDDGHDVTVLSYSNRKSDLEFNPKIKIIYLGYDAEKNNHNMYMKKRLLQLPLLLSIRKHIVAVNPEIVCAFPYSILKMTQCSLFGLNYPIVSSERGNPFLYSKDKLVQIRKVYAKCKLVVFQTEKIQSLLALPNSVVIPNPAIPRKNNVNKKKTGIKNLILAAGRLEHEKGFDVLISCFSEVVKDIDCHLKIYGIGSMKNELIEMVDKYKLHKHVELAGNDSALFENNSDASVFVLSSYTEGMPNVLIEAMMCGMPCVATDCTSGGPRFLLGDGNAGYLVDVGDKKQLIETIKHVLTHQKETYEKVKKANALLNALDPKYIYELWLKSFQSVLCD